MSRDKIIQHRRLRSKRFVQLFFGQNKKVVDESHPDKVAKNATEPAPGGIGFVLSHKDK